MYQYLIYYYAKLCKAQDTPSNLQRNKRMLCSKAKIYYFVSYQLYFEILPLTIPVVAMLTNPIQYLIASRPCVPLPPTLPWGYPYRHTLRLYHINPYLPQGLNLLHFLCSSGHPIKSPN